MVLDDEMEQAALKIQSTFRGHKTRKEIKTTNDDNAKENIQNVDEEVAKLTLESENSETKEEETKQEEPQSSNEKSAKQLQDEEDIAGLVMDEEMEKTALKIQSAFRGKAKRKDPKDGSESYESSAENRTESDSGEEQSPQQSDDTNDMYEYFALNQEYGAEERENSYEGDYSEMANRQSYCEDMRYSMESYDGSAFDQTVQHEQSDEKIDYMQGGGIFPEPSDEYATFEVLSGSSGEDREPRESNESFKNKALQSLNRTTIDEEETVDEEKVIESFNFDSNKDSAEAMYYSLKKNEIEAQKQFSKNSTEVHSSKENKDVKVNEQESEENEDDDDVVVLQSVSSANKMLKYGMSMDDRLLGSILSQDTYAPRGKKIYPDEYFDPLLEETMASHNFLEKLHNISHSDEGKDETPQKYDSNDFGEEDQFIDDFYPGNIRSKIMASSISIADSDYFDPTNNKSIIDDNNIKTALETIHSTDSESTIGSAATKIPVGDKNLIMRRNNNIQFSSIGNAAIDKSLDDFIQSQEMKIDRFDEEPEEYSRMRESVDEWTDDTTTESDMLKKPHVAGVIEIKLEQKNFLTVDERRRTLHREDAIQHSTRSQEDDSSKSSNTSSEKIIDKNVHSDTIVTVVQGQDSIIDTEISVPGESHFQ
jgi:IQ calmodulin-binding motif